MYIQMLSMTTSSWVVFDTPPDQWVLIGASLVLSSGLYVWIRERHLVRKGRTALHPASSISRSATR
jgi:drug/metabolite transporter (DMT)-like permease